VGAVRLALVLLALGCGAARPVARFPTPCVDPLVDADTLVSHEVGAEVTGFASVRDRPDLDGDGAPDWLVFAGATGADTRLVVYVTAGVCAHRVGDIVSDAALAPASARSKGLADLAGSTACEASCCPTARDYVYRFDGETYRLAGTSEHKNQCPTR